MHSLLQHALKCFEYARRRPHIHILVDMRGYAGLITQHYPKSGSKGALMDLVMERE